jgi:hypothetical protein
MRVYLVPFLLLITIGLSAQSYINQAGDSIPTKVYFTTGLFFPTLTTSVRIDSEIGLGTELRLEDGFKFDEQISVFAAGALLRVKERSQFNFSFTNMSRKSNFVIDQQIELDDQTYDVGATLDMSFDVNYYALTWRYSFFNKANWNAGASLGIRAVQFIVNAKAVANQVDKSVSASVTAPAALIGLHGSGYLTERLLGRYTIEYFGLSIKGIDINILETRASLEYFILENVGLGVAYSSTQYRVTEIPFNDDFKGRFVFDFSGANLFLSARF